MLLPLPITLRYHVSFKPNWICREVVVVRSSKPAVGMTAVPLILPLGSVVVVSTATLLMGGAKLV